jgi:hypothetical protein
VFAVSAVVALYDELWSGIAVVAAPSVEAMALGVVAGAVACQALLVVRSGSNARAVEPLAGEAAEHLPLMAAASVARQPQLWLCLLAAAFCSLLECTTARRRPWRPAARSARHRECWPKTQRDRPLQKRPCLRCSA